MISNRITTSEVEAFRDANYASAVLSDAINKLAETGEAQQFLAVLQQLTKAQGGMTSLSRRTGINRQNLYRTFASTGNPKFRSLGTILKGLGFKLAIAPVNEAEENVANNDSNPDNVVNIQPAEAA